MISLDVIINNEEDPLCFGSSRDNHPSTSEPKYTCHDCEYSTSKRSNLMKHIVSKQDENQVYPCDMCEYNGSTARELKFHVKSKHERSSIHVINVDMLQLLKSSLITY